MSLTEIGIKHNTDKAWYWGYTQHYEEWFGALREQPLHFLELGFGGHDDPHAGGESARMWCEWAPAWGVTMLDIVAKDQSLVPEGAVLVTGSQSDAVLLGRVAEAGGLFDIVVDDASHIDELTIASFEVIWPLLAPGGIYCIEDVSSSYTNPVNGGLLTRFVGDHMAKVMARTNEAAAVLGSSDVTRIDVRPGVVAFWKAP